jgi:ribosomal protein S18 acetylase RimI-like enzyme
LAAAARPGQDRGVPLPVAVRELEPTDLVDLEWTGGPQHLAAIAGDLGAAAEGDLVQLVVELPNGRLVGLGAVDFRPARDAGTLWMLSVHELVQGMGIGTALIRALEERVVAEGRHRARIAVEHDNPRAAALYRRLGYAEAGSELQSWPAAHGTVYVTVCTVLERRLGATGTPDPRR